MIKHEKNTKLWDRLRILRVVYDESELCDTGRTCPAGAQFDESITEETFVSLRPSSLERPLASQLS